MKLPRHDFWGAGESDCPADIKAPNGELRTMRCKVCGDGWRQSTDRCLEGLEDLLAETCGVLEVIVHDQPPDLLTDARKVIPRLRSVLGLKPVLPPAPAQTGIAGEGPAAR